ncbi:YqgE/AlgH family protein [Flavicella sp.]|uniref:YqgE/AlgH family protein n=1 Tax=Flavicella sp. TaxID=2957742 RepID=UPI00262D585E|nr:YqgE/AlgH family protein [Flavicella sp.]MDG1805962.1 YqgE/AlgH family protein [Flavicella sp.]
MDSLAPHKGRLLVAEPSILSDSSFNRSVVLLTEHSQDSSIGFILNKPLSYTLRDLIPDIDCDFIVYQGGPVEQDNLYFIHQIPEHIPNSIEVGNGIYWGGNFDSLVDLLNDKKIDSSSIRFFLGYSGWASNQLLDEMDTNSWFCIENSYPNILKEKNNSFWKNHLLEIGGKYKLWANAPSDPKLN